MVRRVFDLVVSPVGLKVLAGLALAGLLLGVTWKIYRSGQDAGREEQKQAAAELIQRGKDAATAAAEADIAEAQKKEAEAVREKEAALAGAALYRQQAQASLAALAGLRREIHQVPEGELHARNVRTLALRPPGADAAGYTPAEERAIAEALESRALLADRLAALEGQVAQQAEATAAQARELAAVREQLRARERQVEAYDRAFTELWNLHPPKRRAWKCLKLWKCGENKLPVPPPAELRRALQSSAGAGEGR